LPFLAALCYKLAGVHEWIGRSQAVIFFAVSLPFFFLVVREIFGDMAATWATFFYSFAPLNIFAGRSFMPDVPSLSLALIGLYFFLRWIDNGRLHRLFGLLSRFYWRCLSGLPTAIIGASLLFLVWQKWR
jgi:4-amino-4-deoxy-L-arabinose transferase-like glycosyltransferase